MNKAGQTQSSFPTFDRHVGSLQGTKRCLCKIFPRGFWRPIPLEMHALGVRLKSNGVRKRYKGKENLLVNVGAGSNGREGWVNVDLYPGKGIDCVYDCRASLPFEDGSVKCIFTEHFFEHIDYTDDVPRFLSECHRVLMDKGVLRIIVPNGEGFLRAYCVEGWEAISQMRPMSPDHVDLDFKWKYNTKMEVVNFIFRQGIQHKFAYDYQTLQFVLKKAGFSVVKQQEFGRSMMGGLAIDLPQRAAESVYAEAMK